MAHRLSSEELVTIHVLTDKHVPARAIARQLGVCESTVRYHQERAASGATDGRADKPFAAEPFVATIDAWLAVHARGDRPINVRDLFEHLATEARYPHSYKSLLRYVRDRFGAPKIRTYRRVETPPGAQAQTDWGVFSDLDLGDGPQRVSAFVMVLSHSRRPAIVWSLREDQLSWLHCHNRAFERLGGIPAINRIDNPKTAISVGAGAWGLVHPTYRAYARSVGFHVDACTPREPQQKAKVESKVRLCRSLIESLGKLFDGLDDLQARTDERVDAWCRRTLCSVTGKSVHDTWRDELALLRPLPVLPEPFDTCVIRPVHKDCTVHFEQRQYAVPFQHAGRDVEVRGCAGKVQVVVDHRVVIEYPRRTQERLLIDPRCYEGESTERVLAPVPLGRMGKRLAEICAMPVEQRPLDLYAALAEVAR